MNANTETGSEDKNASLSFPRSRTPGTEAERIEFSSFYQSNIRQLVSFLLLHGANIADATDVAQETMIDAYMNWRQISNPRAWCYKVASRNFSKAIRANSQERLTATVSDETTPTLLRNSSNDLESWEEEQFVLSFIKGLPPRQREIMAWSLSGYLPAEIASELGVTSELVRASLLKARRTIRSRLESRLDD